MIDNSPKFKNLKSQIYETVNVDLINEIINKQKVIGMNQMYSKAKAYEPNLPNYLFVFDDILSDKQFKHHQTFINSFATTCRHYNILLIILTQVWQ